MSQLRQIDFDSDAWFRFRQDAEERLARLRVKNDFDLPPEETARVRGQIAELKYWLAQPAPEPPRDEPVGI